MNSSQFDVLFSMIRDASFRTRYWDGKSRQYGEGSPEFEIVFKKEPSFSQLLESPSILFGEAYMRGDIEISGSYEAVAKALNNVGAVDFDSFRGKVLGRALAGLSSAVRSLKNQKDDIATHYDLGNDFFSLWLDNATASYSCAYFKHPDDTLEQAQKQKAELVLKKLSIRPGMKLLDIGCGWGWLALSAARDYGADVKAITLSEEQYAAVNGRVLAEGLGGKVSVGLTNYLDLDAREEFDRVVSVGMFEHVGTGHHDQYFAKIGGLLKPGGLSLLHTLTKLTPDETNPWIKKYIFPGGYIPTIADVVGRLPLHGFHLIHAESLRRHYVRTLHCWLENFMRPEVREAVEARFGEGFVRMWSLYLRMSAAFLEIGTLDVHQFVFSKGVCDELPMTLERVYSGPDKTH